MFKGTIWELFSRLFRTNFSVVRTKQSGLIEGLVGRVLASGVVQFEVVSYRVRDYFVADFIAWMTVLWGV